MFSFNKIPRNSAVKTKTDMDHVKKNYNVVKQLASGGFSDMYTVTCRHDKSKMFVAKIVNQTAPGRNIEEEVLLRFRHKNLVCGFEAIKSNIFIIQYLHGQTLQEYLQQEGKIAEIDAASIMYRVADGLNHLHKNSISHGDLKLDNVMICTSGEVKLIDFGLSTKTTESNRLVQPLSAGNLVFAAPEVAAMRPYNPLKSDMWSFGVVLYVVTVGMGFKTENLFKRNFKQIYFPRYISKLLITFLKTSLLQFEPSERKSSEDILQDEWLLRGKFFKVKRVF